MRPRAKTDDGHLSFHVGNVRAEFYVNYSMLDDKKGIILEIEVEKERTTHSATYRILSTTGSESISNEDT